jgi:Cof subfamily protein (haloacid dehalogenase superfamily)
MILGKVSNSSKNEYDATMHIKLVAMDLDGTLLSSDKTISAKVAETIARARSERDVKVVLTTARPPRSTVAYYRQLGLNEPVINLNGALVWEPDTRQILLHKPVPLRTARGIVKWAKQRFPGVRISADVVDRWYTDAEELEELTGLGANHHQPDLIAPTNTWLTTPVTKLLIAGRPEWIETVNWAVRTDIPSQVQAIPADGQMLHVLSRGASKQRSLETLCRQLGIRREEVMAIGDDANDVGMIEWAGVGVAMANGHVSCLQAANLVTDHNDADGVANVMRRFVLFDP